MATVCHMPVTGSATGRATEVRPPSAPHRSPAARQLEVRPQGGVGRRYHRARYLSGLVDWAL